MTRIRSGRPSIIEYSDLHMLPTRADFLDPTQVAAFSKLLATDKPVLFLANDVKDCHESRNVIRDGPKDRDPSFVYHPHIYGVFPDGRKVRVILVDVPVYVDVRADNPEDVWDRISDACHYKCAESSHRGNCVEFTRHEVVYLRPLHGFSREPVPYIRIYFDTLYQRTKMISMLRNHLALSTASDDNLDSYFAKLARDYRFNTAGWNRIGKYKCITDRVPAHGCEITLMVSIEDYCRLQKKQLANYSPQIRSLLERDKSIVLTWDIETHRTIQNGCVPKPNDTDYTIFMLCATLAHHHSMDAFFEVCFVAAPCDIHPDIRLTVVCNTQQEVIRGFQQLLANVRPEFIATFNGNSFDWPLTLEIMRREPQWLLEFRQQVGCMAVQTNGRFAETDKTVLNNDFRGEKYKVNAETQMELTAVCKIPGMIDIDVSPIFTKMYASSEIQRSKSLNFFLGENGLPSKNDMPYKRLFRIYERSMELRVAHHVCHCGKPCAVCTRHVNEVDYVGHDNGVEVIYTKQFIPALMRDGNLVCCHCGKRPQNHKDMAEVAYYCVIDCLRTFQLLSKRSIISEKRQLANMAFVKMFNAVMRADGEKVRNLIGAWCNKRGIAFSNASTNKGDHEKDHYPGAHVFQPICGLNVRRPVTGLDFASLYPSIKQAKNLSPDMIVKDPELAEVLLADGYKLHKIGPFDYERGKEKHSSANEKLIGSGWAVQHCGIIDPARDVKTISGYAKVIISADGSRYTPAEWETLPVEKRGGHKLVTEPIYGRSPLPGERMGITALIVNKLAAKRGPIKRLFVYLSKLREQMIKAGQTSAVADIGMGPTEMTLSEIEFQIAVAEARQKAIKILSNTFYGECGNFRSSVYELLVAAGITTYGQYNIKLAAQFVSAKGFRVQYGDTDSLYLVCPEEIYRDIDAAYESAKNQIDAQLAKVGPDDCLTAITTARQEINKSLEKYAGNKMMTYLTKFKERQIFAEGVPDMEIYARILGYRAKIQYWTDMVAKTMRVMNELKVEVADMLMRDNGTRFLLMEYEEVGFPTVLCGKKKYFLKPHIGTINFESDQIMVRGIDVVKQGQAPVNKDIGYELMHEALSPYNDRDLMELVRAKVTKFFTTSWDPSAFAKASRYRPDKKNLAVHAFVERMCVQHKLYSGDDAESIAKRALYEPPESGDKFKWIYVARPRAYTVRGTMVDMRKSDKMEYVRVYQASQTTNEPLTIDLFEYIDGGLKSLLARFIVYHERFQPPTGIFDVETDAGYKALDGYRSSLAGKYLDELIDLASGRNKLGAREDGLIYRAQYNKINSAVHRTMAIKYGSHAREILDHFDIENEDDRARSTIILEQIQDAARNQVADARPLYNAMMAKFGGDPFRLRRIFISGQRGGLCISRIQRKIITEQIKADTEALREIGAEFGKIIKRHRSSTHALIMDMRCSKDRNEAPSDKVIDRITSLSDEEAEVVSRVAILREKIMAANKLLSELLAFEELVAKGCDSGAAPAITNVAQKRREDVAAMSAVRPIIN